MDFGHVRVESGNYSGVGRWSLVWQGGKGFTGRRWGWRVALRAYDWDRRLGWGCNRSATERGFMRWIQAGPLTASWWSWGKEKE